MFVFLPTPRIHVQESGLFMCKYFFKNMYFCDEKNTANRKDSSMFIMSLNLPGVSLCPD